jgi:hybrid cluster-associated redox disulfide protein
MRDEEIDALLLDEIMARWPQVLRVFIDWHLHCIACPITSFHTLPDSAAAHGYPVDQLRAAVLHAINDEPDAPPPPAPPPRSGEVQTCRRPAQSDRAGL